MSQPPSLLNMRSVSLDSSSLTIPQQDSQPSNSRTCQLPDVDFMNAIFKEIDVDARLKLKEGQAKKELYPEILKQAGQKKNAYGIASIVSTSLANFLEGFIATQTLPRFNTSSLLKVRRILVSELITDDVVRKEALAILDFNDSKKSEEF